MKNLITLAPIFTSLISLSQTVIKTDITFNSSKYNYSITVPISFRLVKATSKNIDLKFVDAFGSSVLVNITDRLPEEYKIDGHNYTEEMIEQSMKPIFPNFRIIHSEKVVISGQKAFLTESIGGAPNLQANTWYFYFFDKAYVITCTCETKRFSTYKPLFIDIANSIILKRNLKN